MTSANPAREPADLPPLPWESPATDTDLEVMREQLGRPMRAVISVARRCGCGRPAVVRTAPRLPDGTPFPTSLYLTLPWLTREVSRVEATGTMAEFTDALGEDSDLAAAYRAAHERYLKRRSELGTVAEIEGISAGGMPTRVKCLHAVVAHALVEGAGINPIGDRIIEQITGHTPDSDLPCACEDAPHATPVAAIDCGTNSIRLLIAAPDPATGTMRDLERRMEIVRLGYGVDRTGAFDPAAITRTLDACRRYQQLITHHGAEQIRFVATSATRDASNREDFLSGVEEILGVRPEVISGDEEAELSFRGAVASIDELPAGEHLVVDIGGGSTEFVLGDDRPHQQRSINVGSVRITERHLHSDPPTEAEIANATADIDHELDAVFAAIDPSAVAALVGVAGTVTTMTAVQLGAETYSPDLTHGARVPISEAIAACERMVRLSRAERSEHSVIHPGRIDVIGAGALIWSRIMTRVGESAGLSEAITSEHDILDGLALSIADAGA